MADFRYFAEINGQTVRLTSIQHDGAVSTKASHFSGLTPDGVRVQATRAIQRKNNPSLHECGPKCVAAKGHLCECSCGGKNHGKGSVTVAANAA